MIGVDQVVIGIGEEGVSLVCAGPLRRRIGSRDEFWRHRRRRPKCRIVQSRKIFARGANRVLLDFLRLPVLACNRALLVGVRSDKTRVDRKSVGGDQTLRQAPLNDGLEKAAQHVALAKAPVAVLGERRMIGDVAVEPQATEME